MKNTLCMLVVAGLMLSICSSVVAQEKQSDEQLLIIHEDIVKPSMVAKYEKAIKAVYNKIKEHNLTSLAYLTAMTDDFHYIFISKVDNYAALDNDPWKELEAKIGKEEMAKLWKGFDGCYTKHKDYMIKLSHDLSYDPQGKGMVEEGVNYRTWHFYYGQPDKELEAEEISKEWRALFEKKQVPNGYRLYKGALGTEQPLYIVVQSATNAVDFSNIEAENMKLLGEEGKALNEKTMAITRKFDVKNGWIRPDLSFMPDMGVASK